MIINKDLTKFSNEDIEEMLFFGNISSKFDDGGNLLIKRNEVQLIDVAISIPTITFFFDSTKIEEKYDVDFKEFESI
jgi:hypothetical protein